MYVIVLDGESVLTNKFERPDTAALPNVISAPFSSLQQDFDLIADINDEIEVLEDKEDLDADPIKKDEVYIEIYKCDSEMM